jgi:hypothetical protein
MFFYAFKMYLEFSRIVMPVFLIWSLEIMIKIGITCSEGYNDAV